MKILVHVHTWDDVDVIGTALDAILKQSYAVRDILIVDNASTDGTPDLPYPDGVTVVRHRRNLGTSGSVETGLEYARAHGFQWLWVLDADSVPRPDALERLVRLVEARCSADRAKIGILSSSHNLIKLGQLNRGRMLTPGGPRMPKIRDDQVCVTCDSVIWSGALINLSVVDRVGLPRAGRDGCWEDLSLDYGDTEYSYRIRHAGYRILVHRTSIIDHPVGKALHGRFLGRTLYTTNHPAARRYLYFRNLVFFWLKIYHRRNWPMLLTWFTYRLAMILMGIVLLERKRGLKVKACLMGIRDGLRGRLDRRY